MHFFFLHSDKTDERKSEHVPQFVTDRKVRYSTRSYTSTRRAKRNIPRKQKAARWTN